MLFLKLLVWLVISDEVLVWLSVWSEVQVIYIWSSWRHCHPIISCFITIKIWFKLSGAGLSRLSRKEAVKWVFLTISLGKVLCIYCRWHRQWTFWLISSVWLCQAVRNWRVFQAALVSNKEFSSDQHWVSFCAFTYWRHVISFIGLYCSKLYVINLLQFYCLAVFFSVSIHCCYYYCFQFPHNWQFYPVLLGCIYIRIT